MLNKDKKKVDNLVYKYENKVNKYSGKNSKKETKYIKLRDSHAAISKLMDKKNKRYTIWNNESWKRFYNQM